MNNIVLVLLIIVIDLLFFAVGLTITGGLLTITEEMKLFLARRKLKRTQRISKELDEKEKQ